MSRAYFKNDLYSYTTYREKEQQIERNKQEEEALLKKKREKEKNKDREESVTRPKPIVMVDDCLTINIDRKENEKNVNNGDDLGELMKSMKKKAPEQDVSKNIFSSGYKPKSTLVIKEDPKEVKKSEEQEKKERKEQYIHLKKMEDEIKQMVRDQRDKEKGKEAGKEGANEEGKQDSKSESEEVVKTKRIKKQANYQRLDLNRRYKDRYLGGLHINMRRFTKNGQLKPKYRAQTELVNEDGEVYNSYISSLSKSLKLTLTLDEDSDEEAPQQPDEPRWLPPQDYTNRQQLTQSLKHYFGFQSFREGQFETIQNILNGKSTLFISQTASGKSLTYILSAMLSKGFCMVVSPLVSLMLDQLDHLPLQLTAACVSSLLKRDQQRKIAEQVKRGAINILFLTPQALQTDFVYHLQDFPQASFVCVDEAHSLSQLSHNFRTSFLTLGDIILNMVKYKGKKPTILGLTATANPQTVHSVIEKLQISEVVRSSSCMNKNLFVTISRQRGQLKYQSLIRYLNDTLIGECHGIMVYTRTRRIMGEVFNYITNSVSAKAAIYHSALSNKEKTETLQKFREGTIKIVVATVALGMGLDFQNLQCVIHLNMPKSIENYVQEIGRAGRRERRAYCHLFLDEGDYITERNYIIADQIEPSLLAMIYQFLKDNSVVRHDKPKKMTVEMRRLDEQLVIKRAAILMEQVNRQEQIIYEEDEEQLDSQEIQQLPQVIQPPKVNSQLFSMRIDKLVEKTQLKEEAILTLILKVEYLLREDKEVRFKVLPTSKELLKIGFYRQNENEIKNSSQFFRRLVDGCKKVKGSIYIPLIDKCNQMQMKPIQLLTRLYRLKDQYFLKVQEENPIFVWQFEGRKVEVEGGIDHELGQLVERGFERLMGGEFIDKVVAEMQEVQQTSLVKLNVLWSLAFLYSRNHITNILQTGRLLPRDAPIPPNSLPKDLDDYFKHNLQEFYNKLTNNGTQIFIPTSMIEHKEIAEIYDCVCLFFKHQMSNEGQLHNSRQIKQARNKAISKYENGKVLTKILMGVNSGEVSWKIYGERTYWMSFKLKNYNELLEVVREQIQRYIENHRSQ